jgi:hypothetical protein
MARPRSINADVVLTFHCSFVLRHAIERAAEMSHLGNASDFIRKATEEACRLVLGPEQWARLQSAADKGLRKELVEGFLRNVEVTRIRRAIDSEGTGSTREGRGNIQQALQSYIQEFEDQKRQTGDDLALGVALDEAIDTIRKISHILSKAQISPGSIRFMQRAAAKIPDTLRADLDAAIINRVARSASLT